MFVLILFSILLILITHHYVIRPLNYWKKRNIPGPDPLPLVGNLGRSFTFRKSTIELYDEIYRKYKECRYVGFFKLTQPAILLRDPEIIKDCWVKSFNHFHDMDVNIDEKTDPIMARNPFFLRGPRWKVVRSQITSSITTGKIRNMFYLINKVAEKLIKHLNEQIKDPPKDGFDAKELCAKFTTDVVALCAFGLDAKSFEVEDSDFRIMGKKFLSNSISSYIRQMLTFALPNLGNFFGVALVPPDVGKWFSQVLTDTMRYREKNNVNRNDYLDLMMSLRSKPGEYEFTDLDVIAQAMTFYSDGFETSSIAIHYCLYDLANNIEAQKQLQKEIDSVLQKHDGLINYDSIQAMSYLDNVFSESLRLHPPPHFLSRRCTEEFTLPPPDDKSEPLKIEKGVSVIVPIYSLQHDELYFPEPDKFNPDRFNDQNKDSIVKYTYMPFGEGPRQCLGVRFAKIQSKAAIAAIISEFDIRVNKKTADPLELDPFSVLIGAKGGIWLDFSKRIK